LTVSSSPAPPKAPKSFLRAVDHENEAHDHAHDEQGRVHGRPVDGFRSFVNHFHASGSWEVAESLGRQARQATTDSCVRRVARRATRANQSRARDIALAAERLRASRAGIDGPPLAAREFVKNVAFARRVSFAMSQPEDVDASEVLFRPTARPRQATGRAVQ